MNMNKHLLRTDSLLLISAIIWGFAFVAQRLGMQHIGPFTFNAIRFMIGGLFLIPIIKFNKTKIPFNPKSTLKYSLISGMILFTASSLQQIGIVYTSAGNAGFITGLYVVFVPILGLLIGRKTGPGMWLGVLFAAGGMYLLSATSNIAVSKGNFLVLISSFFWAIHVLAIDRFTKVADPVRLACIQFLICSLSSFIIALITETILLKSVLAAFLPILYGGLISVGIGFTLQIIAQKKAHPAHASIILSLEAVFAFLGGIVILQEVLNGKRLIGCLLMLIGMLISQLWQRKRKEK